MDGRRAVTRRRTYWHLEPLCRVPTDYEVATSRLLYHPPFGFSVRTPGSAWHERYAAGSPLAGADWEAFADPRRTTYAGYTGLQSRQETFIDGLLASIDETGYDRRLSAAWIEELGAVLPVLRYPVHALQMVAAYVGQAAPGGRVVVACLFQAADEMRRVHRIAYRMRQLQDACPGFGDGARAAWEQAPAWQPLRRLVERLLATYDFGEAFCALNLVVKPAFDQLFMNELARSAEGRGDEMLAKILRALDRDCRWHRAWSQNLVAVATDGLPENRRALERWIETWRPVALEAASAAAALIPGAGAAAEGVGESWHCLWRSAGLFLEAS